jgi:hypothetical protein
MAGYMKMNNGWFFDLVWLVFIILVIFIIILTIEFSGYGLIATYGDLAKPKVYEIRTCEDLQNMNNDLDGTYILMNDIDGRECE